jgi:hypothetical protein
MLFSDDGGATVNLSLRLAAGKFQRKMTIDLQIARKIRRKRRGVRSLSRFKGPS